MTYYHYTAHLYRQATRVWSSAVGAFGGAAIYAIANSVWGPVMVFGATSTAVPFILLENLAAPGTPIELLLLLSVGIGLDVMLWLGYMLYTYPMIAANSAHFKLAGDTSMRLIITITENIPVNRMWDDVKGEVEALVNYAVKFGRSIKPWVKMQIQLLIDMALEWLQFQLAGHFPPPGLKSGTISRILTNVIVSKIVTKLAYPVYVMTSHRDDCYGLRENPWNYAYIGGGTGCLEALFGPTFLNTSVCLTWNPFIAIAEPTPLFRKLWDYVYVRTAAAMACLMYTALRPVLSSFSMAAGMAGAIAVMGAFLFTIPLFIGSSITVVFLKKR